MLPSLTNLVPATYDVSIISLFKILVRAKVSIDLANERYIYIYIPIHIYTHISIDGKEYTITL